MRFSLSLFFVSIFLVFFNLSCSLEPGSVSNDTRLIQHNKLADEASLISEEISDESDPLLRRMINNGFTSLDFSYNSNTDLCVAKYNDYKISLDVSNCLLEDITDNGKIPVPYEISFLGDTESCGIVEFNLNEINDAAILLSFDDKYFTNWQEHFSVFKDNGLAATFFCYGTPDSVLSFCKTAQKQGFEVGYHTQYHKPNLEDRCTMEWLQEQAITPVIELHAKYIYARSFAFPNGRYVDYQLEELLKYYDIVRLFCGEFTLYKPEEIGQKRVIWSQQIDANQFKDDEEFELTMFKRFLIAKITNSVYPCTSHNIIDDFNGNMVVGAITGYRLEWMANVIKKLNMKSSFFKDYYKYVRG